MLDWIKQLWKLSNEVTKHCYRHPIKYIIYTIGTFIISYSVTFAGLSIYTSIQQRREEAKKISEQKKEEA